MMFVICFGSRLRPSSTGIREVFPLSFWMFLRLRSRVRSTPPGILRVMLVGDSDAITPTELLSIYPMVMDYTELNPPHELEGRSLRPLLEDVNATWDHPAWTTFVDHHSLKTERWRYIRYSSGEEELYDTKHDPHELTNLVYKEPEKPLITETLNTLRAQLDGLLESKD